MTNDAPHPSDFTEGWSRDIFSEDDPDTVKRELESDWKRDLLLADYVQAAEDGRNRDQLLHNSYYVALVLFGLLVNAALTLLNRGRFGILSAVSISGAILFFLLYIWAVSSKGARDASWDRRSEIEDMVKVVDANLLRSNDSAFKRIERLRDGEYQNRGKKWSERRSVSKMVIYAVAIIGISWLGVFTVSLCFWIQL